MPRRSLSDYRQFVEAAVLLSAASLAVRWLPFRQVVRTMGKRGLARTPSTGDLLRVRQAVQRASRRVPWRTVCFQQGLATHWLLRRRGIDSRLHYGIKPDGERLSAHVWIEVDGEVVIGEEEQGGAHARVAVFPSEGS